MATLNDSAGIFTGDALDAFNEMEAFVSAGGDAAGAAARLIPVMLQIVADKQSPPDSTNPSAAVDTPR